MTRLRDLSARDRVRFQQERLDLEEALYRTKEATWHAWDLACSIGEDATAREIKVIHDKTVDLWQKRKNPMSSR